MTVKELIADLSKFPPDEEVRVHADCCGYPHPIKRVRDRNEEEDWGKFSDEAGLCVVLVSE